MEHADPVAGVDELDRTALRAGLLGGLGCLATLLLTAPQPAWWWAILLPGSAAVCVGSGILAERWLPELRDGRRGTAGALIAAGSPQDVRNEVVRSDPESAPAVSGVPAP